MDGGPAGESSPYLTVVAKWFAKQVEDKKVCNNAANNQVAIKDFIEEYFKARV